MRCIALYAELTPDASLPAERLNWSQELRMLLQVQQLVTNLMQFQ